MRIRLLFLLPIGIKCPTRFGCHRIIIPVLVQIIISPYPESRGPVVKIITNRALKVWISLVIAKIFDVVIIRTPTLLGMVLQKGSREFRDGQSDVPSCFLMIRVDYNRL